MNWQEIVDNSELIYASTPEDKGFRTWSFKKTNCEVSFFESYPIEDFDKIICSIVETNNCCISENKIATFLGFNVVDNFELTQKRYADHAELEIFRALMKPVIEWGLVIKETANYLLTEFGRTALETGIKYRFYSGEKILFENSNIRPAALQQNLFFPFFTTLGISSEITNKKQISYDKINLSEVFKIEEAELVKRHKLQSNKLHNIYQSNTTKYYTFDSCQIDYRLFKHNEVYYPIVFYQNAISAEATELLHLPDNIKEKEKKIEWGLYLKLIKDPNAILDYNTIIPFEDLLELDSLIKDSRLVWHDRQLFELITNNCSANEWFDISNYCPLDVLKLNLEKHKSELDWTSLSLRIDDGFLIQNATNYPWNFEAISAKENISIEVIKTLLLVPELKDQEWDWETIMPKLEFNFIKSNIDNIEFDLLELTKSNKEDVLSLISDYPSKRWNWTFISSEYDLSFILENILTFSTYLNLKKVISRAFVAEEYINQFCASANFYKVLTTAKDSSLKDYLPNQAEYFWTEQLIELLEATGYIVWESGIYVSGFECNPYIKWNYYFFRKHHKKIETQRGYDFVSKQISDYRIVVDYIDFDWNWDIISANINLICHSEFILSVKNRLNTSILLSHIPGEILESIFNRANIFSYLETNQELWTVVTKIFSIDFIRNHINYNWDWQVLTKRFSSSIKIEALGNPKWIDKWDWKYLTLNLDVSIISENLNLYLDYWDWHYLTENLDKDFVLKNLSNYNDYWNWEILLKSRLEKSDLQLSEYLPEVAACISLTNSDLKQQLWKIITSKFDYQELEHLIAQTFFQDVFHWDYRYFYDLSNFNPRQYLQENSEYVDWPSLSGSKALNKSFRWDKTLFNYEVWLKDISKVLKNKSYRWDFMSLSGLDNINWNDSILSIETEKWDWEYLSEFSSCFKKGKDFTKRFRKFSKYIKFGIFSKRTDADITEKLLTETIDEEWDWALLSANRSIKLSIDFINENKEKSWNWEALSVRNDIKFENEIFIELSNQNWDWLALSKRTDINFSEELIIKLQDKPFDWYLVSQNNTFPPNAKVLSILRNQTLDWTAISQSPNLAIDILWDYKDSLDWEKVTKNKVVDISDESFLNKYQDYLFWDYISQSDKFKVSFENLKQFKDKLNWSVINSRRDFSVSQELLEPFADVLDWSIVSESMDIQFTSELIEKYRNKWDWQVLKTNPQIIEKLEDTLYKYKKEINSIEFLEKFDRTPYIYHFTHLFNAVEIIKNRKILCRHIAEGKFANAAGTNVQRRSTAHNFARFYFRPQTPTQFYNECLGWDNFLFTSYGKSYYFQARNLGLPKCPIPVFFKFDLKEVLMKMYDKCYYSTGNMQTDRARVLKVADDPSSLQTNYLYDNISDAFSMAGGPKNYNRQQHISIMENIKEYSQQEFLILEEFDFSQLDSFEIICYNSDYANLLKAQLGNDSICKKINAFNNDIFHRSNREILVNENDSEISISSGYQDNAYLLIKGEGLKNIQILNPDRIQKETSTEIIAYPEIKFTKTVQPIEVHFVDLTIGTRDWLIYKN